MKFQPISIKRRAGFSFEVHFEMTQNYKRGGGEEIRRKLPQKYSITYECPKNPWKCHKDPKTGKATPSTTGLTAIKPRNAEAVLRHGQTNGQMDRQEQTEGRSEEG